MCTLKNQVATFSKLTARIVHDIGWDRSNMQYLYVYKLLFERLPNPQKWNFSNLHSNNDPDWKGYKIVEFASAVVELARSAT